MRTVPRHARSRPRPRLPLPPALATERRRWSGRVTVALVWTLALCLVGGSASAFWTVGGAGSGSAAGRTSQPVSVTITPGATLFPGASVSGQLAFTNPNPFAVLVTQVLPAAPTVSGGTAGCTAASSAVTFATLNGSWTVPASGSLNPAAVSGAVSMGTSSDNGCQGATFSSTVTITARSA